MPTELGIQKEILQYLALRKDVTVWRNNTGAHGGVRQNKAGEAKRWFVRYGKVGQADITGLFKPWGTRLEIEVKTPGNGATEKQLAFGDSIREAGGIYMVVRSVEEVREKLDLVISGYAAR